MRGAHDWQISARETLEALLKHFGSAQRLALQLGRTDRTIRDWRKTPEQITREGFDLIRALAQKEGIPVPRSVAPPTLYDRSLSYDANQHRRLGVWPQPDSSLSSLNDVFLGRRVRNLFGASASVVTANSDLIDFLSHFGCSIITYKTARFVETPSHPAYNIYVCVPGTRSLDSMPADHTVIVSTDGDYDHGQVNRFGMPSASPVIWQEDFARAKSLLGPDQVLILSVVGSCETDSREELAQNFGEVVQLGIDAGADIIELNLSCPNCSGPEALVYQDVHTSRLICAAARESARSRAQLLAKIGYLDREPLRLFVEQTAEFVDGWSAINTVPVRALKMGIDGYEPAYDSADRRVGLAGPPIFPLALRCLRDLVDIRSALDLTDKVIVAMGGVSRPEDVQMMLDAGANAVQAANVFFGNPTFGEDVHRELRKKRDSESNRTNQHVEAALGNWVTAVGELNLASSDELATAAQVFVEWKSTYLRAAAARKGALPASVDYFRQTITIRLPHRFRS